MIVYFIWGFFGCLLTPKKSPSQPESITSQQEERTDVIELKTAEQLPNVEGKLVIVQGTAIRSKVGSFIQFESNTLWTKSTDLGDYMEKSIRVTGRIVRGVSPYRSFPVAKQDEDGAWSQGVGAPTDFVDPNAQLLGIPQKPSKKKEASKDHRAWFIEIQKISAVE